jgi:hypothetical protein
LISPLLGDNLRFALLNVGVEIFITVIETWKTGLPSWAHRCATAQKVPYGMICREFGWNGESSVTTIICRSSIAATASIVRVSPGGGTGHQ